MEKDTFYHGTEAKNVTIKSHIRSRYGFPAIFLTNNIRLATLYKGRSGSLWSLQDVTAYKVIDYNGKLSYSADFRNYVYKLYKENHRSVLIKNVLDYPSSDRKLLEVSDILILFDVSMAQEIKPVLF